MQVRNNVDYNNFGARWSRKLLGEVRSMRSKNPQLFDEIKKLHPNKIIDRDYNGWYVLKQKGKPQIHVIPGYYDYLHKKYFNLDLIFAKSLKSALEKIK